MDFIPYKSHETLEHKYYQIPQELFVNEFAKTKEILKNATLELPNTLELQDIKKLVLNRDKTIGRTRKYYRRIKSHKSTWVGWQNEFDKKSCWRNYI